jgi:hypothetical protein
MEEAVTDAGEVTWNIPKPTWTIKFGQVTIYHNAGKIPCRFHRWMYRVLLGWEVAEIKSVPH